MSYNKSPLGWTTWLTDADIKALHMIWGEKSNDGSFNDINQFLGTKRRDKLTGSTGTTISMAMQVMIALIQGNLTTEEM